MPRATNAPSRRRRRKKVLKQARGFYGRQKSSIRVAAGKVMRALAYAYDGRKIKKRDFRTLWNARINAAARKCGTTYSQLIHKLSQKGIELDRKILADIAVNDFDGFAKLVEMASG